MPLFLLRVLSLSGSKRKSSASFLKASQVHSSPLPILGLLQNHKMIEWLSLKGMKIYESSFSGHCSHMLTQTFWHLRLKPDKLRYICFALL